MPPILGNMSNDELLSTAQVADRLGVTAYSVNRYVRDGKLKVEVQVPGPKGARLYHPAEVDRFAATLAVRS